MENKSKLVSISLAIALIIGFFYYDNQINNLEQSHINSLTKTQSEHNLRIQELEYSHRETISKLQNSNNNKQTATSDTGAPINSKGTIITTHAEDKTTTDTSTLITNLQNNIIDLKTKVIERDALIDSMEYDASKSNNAQVVCSEAKQKQNSCKNIDTIELQLIEKNSQLKEAQKALSLAKINVAVLLDEKERANKAITAAKNLTESLKIVEEKLYSSQQDLQKSLNSQTELSNIVTVKSGIVESLNNKLKIIEKDIATTKNDLSASIKDNEINTSELSQTTEKLITALKQLRSTELELKISEIKLSNISNTKTDQNKRIMSNSIDRVKKSKENKGVNFSVYLTGFSEEEINDYCLSIKDSATQDVEAFGIIISSDEEAKSTYKKLCVETNLDN